MSEHEHTFAPTTDELTKYRCAECAVGMTMATTDDRIDLATRRAELFLAKEKHMSLPIDIDQIAAEGWRLRHAKV